MAGSYGREPARMLRLPVKSMHPRLLQPCLCACALLALIHAGGCERPSSAPPQPAPQQPVDAKPAKSDEVKIAKENWPNGKLKFYNELRRNAEGKWTRTGVGRAYYDHGVLEREGLYRNDERVGEWKYYDQNGKLLRVEQRGEGKT